MNGIEWLDVKKRFGRHHALAGVTLEVAASERVALVGENGSGKTTLLRIAATLCRPDAGQVRIAGLDARRDALQVRRRVGYMPQRIHLPAAVSVAEVLGFFARLNRLAADRIEAVTAQLGLKDFVDKRCGALSGGMAQRVALAITLLPEPDVILLDEPTSGLDPRRATDLRHLLLSAAEAGCTLVMATHQLEDVAVLAERTVILEAGQIVGDMPAKAALEHMASQQELGAMLPKHRPGKEAARTQAKTIVKRLQEGVS